MHQEMNRRREVVLLSMVEVPKENWSYGNGEARYVAPHASCSQ